MTYVHLIDHGREVELNADEPLATLTARALYLLERMERNAPTTDVTPMGDNQS